MNIFRLLAFGLVGILTPMPVRAASDDVSAVAAQTPVADVLQMYGIISGRKVIPTDEVRALKLYVNFKIMKTPKTEAQRLIEAALLEQAGVVLVPMSDGTVEARLVGHGR
jgi:hypothetical protein